MGRTHGFVRRLVADRDALARIPTAVVVAVSSGVEALTIRYRGAVIPGVMFLDSYADPQAGDRVVVQSYDGVLFVLGSLGAAQAAYGPQLAPNEGFELGVLGQPPSSWQDFWGEKAAQDAAQFLSGSRAARLESATLVGSDAARLSMVPATEVDPGATYRISAWFKGSSVNPNLTTRIQIITAPTPEGADFFGTDSVVTTVAFSALATEWTEVVGTRVVPADHRYARLSLDLVSSATPGSSFAWVDEVSFRKQL